MIMTFLVHANYGPKLDKRREERIHAALTRCDAWGNRPPLLGSINDQDVQVHFSNVNWCSSDNNKDTEIEIYVDTEERARRLAGELRCCGLAVAVSREETR
jgi:hypothetical protein